MQTTTHRIHLCQAHSRLIDHLQLSQSSWKRLSDIALVNDQWRGIHERLINIVQNQKPLLSCPSNSRVSGSCPVQRSEVRGQICEGHVTVIHPRHLQISIFLKTTHTQLTLTVTVFFLFTLLTFHCFYFFLLRFAVSKKLKIEFWWENIHIWDRFFKFLCVKTMILIFDWRKSNLSFSRPSSSSSVLIDTSDLWIQVVTNTKASDAAFRVRL